ncbi:ABC transporter permease [Prauserella cavernicola]|uniref:ABC transporter permease n=1 Tax=Prauserella cavernicola TaxID=2800127 RepID=A0A934QSE9_9PSEU|nr:ABC transporter permease [Prauserella cavernicola]MBK1785462.1 ABC transporter permease [Prauserella cavernicola]
MTDTIASEWWKVRTVRSTYWLLATVGAVFAVGCLSTVLMVADWDTASPSAKEAFPSADMSPLVLPFVQFCAGAFGAFALTSEYGSGMIRTTLTTVPRRGLLFTAKALVVAGLTVATGLVLTFAMLGGAGVIAGDRPAPIQPWPSLADGVPSALASAVVLTVTAIVGFGLGALLRSAAGALVTLTGLLFVLPVAATFLPADWSRPVGALTLNNLGPQLAGEVGDPVLSPVGAALVLGGYVLLALGAGAFSVLRRDA